MVHLSCSWDMKFGKILTNFSGKSENKLCFNFSMAIILYDILVYSHQYLLGLHLQCMNISVQNMVSAISKTVVV